MATLGITGPPNSGKSSLFAALTDRHEGIAPFPFSTTAARVGVVAMEDPVLEEVGRLEGSKRITYSALEATDTPPRSRSGGEHDTETMGRLRQSDCLVVVLRSFNDPAIPDSESGVDPVQQAEETMLDLAIADADMFERSLVRLRNQATSRPERRAVYEVVARAAAIAREGDMLRSAPWSKAERTALADFAPLTLKPIIWVVNADEDLHSSTDHRLREVVPDRDPVLTLTLALEAEAASLDPGDRKEMREAFGLGQGASSTVAQAATSALGLCTFYTAGRRETRAWLTPHGSSARQAAGKIHSDMERGFIRAEVATARTVIDAGGWDAARGKGMVRVEGRDYTVQPQDLMHVRFSV